MAVRCPSSLAASYISRNSNMRTHMCALVGALRSHVAGQGRIHGADQRLSHSPRDWLPRRQRLPHELDSAPNHMPPCRYPRHWAEPDDWPWVEPDARPWVEPVASRRASSRSSPPRSKRRVSTAMVLVWIRAVASCGPRITREAHSVPQLGEQPLDDPCSALSSRAPQHRFA